MSEASKREYLRAIYPRYHAATAEQKGRILDEFTMTCGYNRKYAIRLLNAPPPSLDSPAAPKRSGRKPCYHTPAIKTFLEQLLVASNLACSKRLVAMIPLWLPHANPSIDAQTQALLLSISPATIDRVLAGSRRRHGKLGLATTKPGSLLRKHIPIKTSQWDESRPGFLEADTVAHCGSSAAGSFVYSVNFVDIATGWSAFAAVWGRGQTGVFHALKALEQELPFRILGFDSDNGSEFINHYLLEYFTKRRRPVEYTRSRPYQSNDNAHIEQKNWTNIRQYLGYLRFENAAIVPLLNDLYSTELSLLVNFFLPSFKLVEKRREGALVIKRHDPPKTPCDRLLPHLSPAKQRQLKRLRASLNPFELQQAIRRKVLAIPALATPP
jgi:hypothetical protein